MLLEESIVRLRQSALQLQARGADDRILALHRWASAWESPDYVGWKECRRLDEPGVETPLLTLARSARQDSVRALLQEQIGIPSALDEFMPRAGGGRRKAAGFPLVAFFASRGAALSTWPVMLTGLLMGSAVFVRSSTSDRGWPGLLKATLAQFDPEMASAIEIATWPADDISRHRQLVEAADVVIAHGSDETIGTIRDLTPVANRFLGFGSRISVAVIGPGMDLEAAACAAARDIAIYDQAGCLSPQAVLVEGTLERATSFGQALDKALASVRSGASLDHRSPELQSAIRRERELAAFGDRTLVIGPDSLAWTVIVNPDREFPLSPLGCTVHLRPWESEAALTRLLRPYHSMLQAVGIAALTDDAYVRLASLGAAEGATRVCLLGEMQQPRLNWSHDGRALLSNMVRFIDLDP